MSGKRISRRRFLGGTAAAAVFTIVPRHVLGGPGHTPPSDVLTRAVIGTGGRGSGFVNRNAEGRPPVTLAVCDVDRNHLDRALGKAGPGCEGYTDFRRVLERKDIDVVYIGTPPHWHSLMSIAAAQAGKDIYCEKPMAKFIAEGQAVADAVRRYGRIYQIGTFGRFGSGRLRKVLLSGALGWPVTVRAGRRHGYNWKVREWSGLTRLDPQPVPSVLDYNMWLGPATVKPYHPHRVHSSFRGYWDYDGGGLADMGQHYLDGIQYALGKDHTSPVEIEAYSPWPAHPDACGLWGRVTMRYDDGTTIILESGEWGEAEAGEHAWIEGPKGRIHKGGRTEPEGLFRQAESLPNPEPMIGNGVGGFEKAVRLRKQCSGNADVSHRCATLLYLANIAIRAGRRLRYDPARQRFVNDDEANRLVDIPMRAPWHL